MIRNLNFLGYANLCMCWFSLKYFICWKIIIFIQNVILCNNTLGKSVIFQVKSTLQFFAEIEQFFEKDVNLVVNLVKNDTWF